MEQASQLFSKPIFSDLMLYLPVFGLLIAVVVLLSLLFQRERLIVPGNITGIVVFLIAAVVFEYSAELRSAIEKYWAPEQPVPAAAPEKVTQAPEPEPEAEEPVPEKPKEERPAPSSKKLVALDRSILEDQPEEEKPSGLSIIREPARPAPSPRVPARPAPAPRPSPTPVVPKEPEPKEEPLVVTPPPQPKPTPKQPPPQPAPTSRTNNYQVAVSSPSATTGNIRIEIHGPLLEISKSHSPDAHLMIILDRKIQQVIPPTRDRPDYIETDMGKKGQLTSVTYFWEDVVVNFKNLQQGPHSVMIDTALVAPGSHRSQMIGPKNLENDWNGFVDVTAGKTTPLVFGGKNWMTQQLDRLR
jgi:hypothetical protein